MKAFEAIEMMFLDIHLMNENGEGKEMERGGCLQIGGVAASRPSFSALVCNAQTLQEFQQKAGRHILHTRHFQFLDMPPPRATVKKETHSA